MATILPFHGTLYNPAVVGHIEDVVAPPYDIIDASQQQALHQRHAQNVIRLELGLDRPGDGDSHNRYSRAATDLRAWLKSGALRRDLQPSVYVHTIEYRPPFAESVAPTRLLKGFLATVELEEFGSGHIYPHENTRAAAKTDRLNLLEACRANFSPIWSLYSDPSGHILQLLEKSIQADQPRIDFVDDGGFRQRLWSITNPSILGEVSRAMTTKPLFIADGHHRYETALNYRRLRRQQEGARGGRRPYDSVLMLFSSLEDPGLTVLPTHRVVTTPVPTLPEMKKLLAAAFEIEEVPSSISSRRSTRQRFIDQLRTKGRSIPMFGLSLRGAENYLLLTLRSSHRPSPTASPRDRLDVSLLQQHVVTKLCPTQKEQEAMKYTKDDHEALDWTEQGTGQAALLLNPTKVSEVQAVASAGERMPHKSTYFFPKPLTGLVINIMEP
ncbi:MAG: DUF1015 domain-containing protein [Nitrospiraceae bacterium]